MRREKFNEPALIGVNAVLLKYCTNNVLLWTIEFLNSVGLSLILNV